MVLPAEGRVETRITDDGRLRPAAWVLMAAIVTWLVTTVVILVQIAVVVLPDPSSHKAEETLVFGMFVFVPQVVVALVGLAALGSLRRRETRAPSLGILWGVLQTASVLWAYLMIGSGTQLVYVGLVVVALIGLAAAIVLRMTRPARAA